MLGKNSLRDYGAHVKKIRVQFSLFNLEAGAKKNAVFQRKIGNVEIVGVK